MPRPKLEIVPSRAERLRVVKALYDALGRENLDSLVTLLTQDCRVRLIGERTVNPLAGMRHGHEGFRAVMGRMFELFAIVDLVVDRVLLQGDDAAVYWFVAARRRDNNEIMEFERCDLLRFSGNKVCDVIHFFDTASTAVAFGRLTPTHDAGAASIARALKITDPTEA